MWHIHKYKVMLEREIYNPLHPYNYAQLNPSEGPMYDMIATCHISGRRFFFSLPEVRDESCDDVTLCALSLSVFKRWHVTSAQPKTVMTLEPVMLFPPLLGWATTDCILVGRSMTSAGGGPLIHGSSS